MEAAGERDTGLQDLDFRLAPVPALLERLDKAVECDAVTGAQVHWNLVNGQGRGVCRPIHPRPPTRSGQNNKSGASVRMRCEALRSARGVSQIWWMFVRIGKLAGAGSVWAGTWQLASARRTAKPRPRGRLRARKQRNGMAEFI